MGKKSPREKLFCKSNAAEYFIMVSSLKVLSREMDPVEIRLIR